MTRGDWYNQITRNRHDLDQVTQAITYFDAESADARAEANQLRGKRMAEVQAMLPGLYGYRWAQFKELEAIGTWLSIQEDVALGARRRHYVEHYNRALTDRMAEKFAEGDTEVIAVRVLQNHVAAVGLKFEAVVKQLDLLNWQLTNITKLICADKLDAIL